MKRTQSTTAKQARRLFELQRYHACLQALRFDPEQSEHWSGDAHLLALGAACLDRLGWLEKAGIAFQRAATSASLPLSAETGVDLLVRAAVCFGRSDRPARAKPAMARATELAAGLGPGRARAALLAVGALERFHAGAAGSSVLRDLGDALRMAQDADPEGRALAAWICVRQAVVHRRLGEPQLGLARLEAAQALLPAEPTDPLLGAIHRHRGVLRAALLELHQAAQDHLRALQLARVAGAVVCEADVQRSLGALYRRLGRHSEAVTSLGLARTRYVSLGLTARAGLTASELGHVHFCRGLFQKALEEYSTDLAGLEQRTDPKERWFRARSHVMRRIGQCQRLTANIPEMHGSRPLRRRSIRGRRRAFRTLERAALLAESGGDPVSRALAWVEQGRVLLDSGDWKQALQRALQARDLVSGQGTPATLSAIDRLEAAATGARQPVQAVALLQRALDRLQSDVPTVREVETRLELSRMLDLSGKREEALKHDRLAYRGAVSLDAVHLVEGLLPRLMIEAPDEVVAGSLDAPPAPPPARPAFVRPRVEGDRREALDGLVGASPAMQELRGRIERAAHRDMPVLITGETGTGKTLVARSIHLGSARRAGQFLAVNVGALNESLVDSELFGHREGAFTGANERRLGAFRTANGGSLLLDEIADLPVACQVKLLTVLEERHVRPLGEDLPVWVDVRLLFATHRDLRGLVMNGTFRQDLLERIRHYEIHVPSLRERAGDIPVLARYFLAQMGGEAHLSPAALERLMGHSWPGNVRELKHVLEAAVVDAGPGGILMPFHLGRLDSWTAVVGPAGPGVPAVAPPRANEPVSTRAPLATASPAAPAAPVDLDTEALDAVLTRLEQRGVPLLEAISRSTMQWALERCGGRVSEAAQILGIHRNTLTRRHPRCRRARR